MISITWTFMDTVAVAFFVGSMVAIICWQLAEDRRNDEYWKRWER